MNEVVKNLLLILLRYAVVAALTALATHHVISEEQLKGFLAYFTDPEVLGYAVLALSVVASAGWAWIRSKRKLLTALSTMPTTEKAVEQMVKTDAPLLSTPKTEVPVPQTKKE